MLRNHHFPLATDGQKKSRLATRSVIPVDDAPGSHAIEFAACLVYNLLLILRVFLDRLTCLLDKGAQT